MNVQWSTTSPDLFYLRWSLLSLGGHIWPFHQSCKMKQQINTYNYSFKTQALAWLFFTQELGATYLFGVHIIRHPVKPRGLQLFVHLFCLFSDSRNGRGTHAYSLKFFILIPHTPPSSPVFASDFPMVLMSVIQYPSLLSFMILSFASWVTLGK